MIPKSALLLAIAGLIPFLVCAGVGLSGNQVVLRGAEDVIMLRYGIIILAFMSGVLWGFAANASGRRATVAYGLSVLPALWAFFTAVGPTPQALAALIPGFYGLLALDFFFWRAGLAPPWWMRLRLPLTAVVMVTLGIGIYM
jgi:hypothetical protein